MILSLFVAALSLLVLGAFSFAASAVPVLIAKVAADTGVPTATAGLYTALVYGGAVLSARVSAGFLGRWGGIRSLQACLVLSAPGLAVGATGGMLGLLAGALLLGLGYGPGTPATALLLTTHTPRRHYGIAYSAVRRLERGAVEDRDLGHAHGRRTGRDGEGNRDHPAGRAGGALPLRKLTGAVRAHRAVTMHAGVDQRRQLGRALKRRIKADPKLAQKRQIRAEACRNNQLIHLDVTTATV